MSLPSLPIPFLPPSLYSPSKPPGYLIPLSLGLTASSYWVMSNLAGMSFGVYPLMLSKEERRKIGLQEGVGGGVKVFGWMLDNSSGPIVISMAISFISYLTASFKVPGKDPSTVNLLRLAAGLTILPIPLSVWKLVPINHHLKSLSHRNPSTQPLTAEEELQASKMLATWWGWHKLRIGVYGVAMALGLVVLGAA